MFDPQTELLTHFLAARAAEVAADAANEGAWSAAAEALGKVRDVEPDLAAAVAAKDPALLKAILDGWASGRRPVPEHDRDLLKRAMRAFRKRLRLTLLDADSGIGGGPMSGGRSSDISGVTAPGVYPRAIWLELARQGRLINAGQGVFELPPGQQVE
jgi:hypothetical protein